jgi:hypothetical protein
MSRLSRARAAVLNALEGEGARVLEISKQGKRRV